MSRKAAQPKNSIKLCIPTFLCLWASFFYCASASAQSDEILSDNSLGSEQSIIMFTNPNTANIEGGAIRGNRLFHSFLEFSISEGNAAYFSTPPIVETIFSRVTGANPSHLFGTLGVLGDADLYFLNPNGIIFGPNSQLDISGSFIASTASAVLLGDNQQFSAVSPEEAPLIVMDVPLTIGLEFEGEAPGTVTNNGILAVGNDLTLAGDNLDLQGQLYAGRDLNLQAKDTLQIRDSAEAPFIAAAANQLLIQGNQLVDIYTLDHSESGLFSGGDMTLRSANTIGGDTHYWVGNDFRIEQLDGELGNMFSPYDPIVLAIGDVIFGNYTGASLHVLAGGSVTLGDITITQTENVTNAIGPNNTNQFIADLASVPLSNSTEPFEIDGNEKPTLDVRAGIDWESLGGLPAPLQDIVIPTGSVIPQPTFEAPATSSTIAVGDITNRGGVVLLTNLYEPDTQLSGEITVNSIDVSGDLFNLANGGSITVDSREEIKINESAIIDASADSFLVFFFGDGGDVNLLAQKDIVLEPGSSIESTGFLGGDIVINSSQGSLFINDSIITSISSDTGRANDAAEAGEISLGAQSIFLNNFARVIAGALSGENSGGNITVEASETVRIVSDSGESQVVAGSFLVDLIRNNIAGTGLATATLGESDAGNITINTGQLTILNNNDPVDPNNPGDSTTPPSSFFDFTLTGVSSATLPNTSGSGGDLVVTADSVEIIGNQPGVFNPPSNSLTANLIRDVPTGLTTATQGTGSPGNLTVNVNELRMRDGAAITTGNVALNGTQSDRGTLTVNAAQLVDLKGKTALATATVGTGNAGNLVVNVESDGQGVLLRDGAIISADTLIPENTPNSNNLRSGDAGNLTITAPVLSISNNSRIGAASGPNGGQAGNLEIQTDILQVSNSLISTSTEDSTAGELIVNANESIVLTGELPAGTPGGLLAQATEGGRAGSLDIRTVQLVVEDGASVTVSSPQGEAGDLGISSNFIILDQGGRLTAEAGQSGTTDGTNILLQGLDFLLLRNGSLISAQAFEDADGGNITIDAESGFVVGPSTENSDIIANADRGNGGNVSITTAGLFGLEEREQRTPLSDIFVSSNFGLDGSFILESLGIDPSRGLSNLTEETSETEVSQDCLIAGNQDAVGFFEPGLEGIPTQVEEIFSADLISDDWLSLNSQDTAPENLEAISKPSSTESTQITPVTLSFCYGN